MEHVADFLSQLAAKLGTTIEHLWPVWVKGCQASAISDFFVSLFVVVLSVFGLIYGFTTIKNKSWMHKTEENQLVIIIITILSACAFIIFGFICVGNFSDFIVAWLYPESLALVQLVKMMKGF